MDSSKIHLTPKQKIEITEIPKGSVIDIGGGGEGVIGQIGGKRITAIDKRESEIDEAKELAPEANFVIADATKLPFSEKEFDNATMFFSGMYMDDEVVTKAFKEIYRVIKTDGELWLWDSVVQNDKETFVIQLDYTLPNGKTKGTGYGTRIFKDQSVDVIKEKLEKLDFVVSIIERHEYWYFLKAKKK